MFWIILGVCGRAVFEKIYVSSGPLKCETDRRKDIVGKMFSAPLQKKNI